MVDPDNAWDRKYIDGDPAKGRTKWFGIVVPAYLLDGWHGAKLLRQGFQYLTVYCGTVVGFLLYPDVNFWIVFLSGLICFSILNHYSHNVWFFDGILLKRYWKKSKKTVDKL
jgi:hypothetical protein